jgi:5-methylcytosine-specific restriction endonuclease McrA
MASIEIPRTAKQAAGVAYRLRNKEAIQIRKAKRQHEHPEFRRAASARRRAIAQVGMDDLDKLLSVWYRKAIKYDPCFYCGATEGIFHDDHYRALRGTAPQGTDHWYNLVRACATCNLRKNNMHGDDFIALINTNN